MAQTTGDSSKIEVWGSDRVAQGALPLVTPSQSTIEKGFVAGIASSNDLTYAPNLLGSKINHCLQNGVPLWNATTAYVVGNMVTHSNKAWQCLVGNTNSAPVDGNANWDKVLTVATPPSANSVLPSQTGNAGKVLTTNGTTASWGNVPFAFVNFDATATANLTGTYTRTGTLVTAVVTAHGHTTGHYIYAQHTTGGAVNGFYQVTVIDVDTFTYNTVASGAIASSNITLPRRPRTKAFNVANVPYDVSNTHINMVNFITQAPDADYLFVAGTRNVNNDNAGRMLHQQLDDVKTVNAMTIRIYDANANAALAKNAHLVIFT